MRLPVRIRLALASCAIFVVLIAGVEFVAFATVRAAIDSVVDHELETRLAGLDDHLARHLNRVPWPELRESLKAHPAFQPDLLRITDAAGTVMLEGVGLQRLAALPSGAVSIATLGQGDTTLRVLRARRAINGRAYDLVLATDLSFSAKILGRLWAAMWLSLPAVLMLAGGAGYWMSGRAMRPVSNIIAAARAIDSTRLDQRIQVPRTGDEIQRLAETMNSMLAGIAASFH
jgi:HAMP domain-containing protein